MGRFFVNILFFSFIILVSSLIANPANAQFNNIDQVPITQSGPNDLIPPITVRKDTLEAMDGMKALTNVDPNQGSIGIIGGRIGLNNSRGDVRWTLQQFTNHETLRTNNKIVHRYHLRNTGLIGHTLKNVTHDVLSSLWDFFDCIAWAANGVCVRMTWTGPKLDLMREYRWPVDLNSLVSHKGINGYMPLGTHNLAIRAADAAYRFIAPTDMRLAKYMVSNITKIAGATHLMKSYNYNLAGGVGSPPSSDFNAIKNARREDGSEAYNRDTRLSNEGSTNGSSTNVEYHVMPSAFDFLFRSAFFGIPLVGGCHNKKTPGIHYSDWPNGVAYARSFPVNTFMFASDMRQKLLDPLGCTKKYSKDRTSPRDMGYPHFLPGMPFDSTNCLGGNQQGLFPLTSRVLQKYYTTAAEVGYLRGATAARRGAFTPGNWYKFSLKDDRVHWTRNDRMFDGCVGLQHSAMDPHFLTENTHATFISTNGKTEDPWHVGEHWRRFRCCKGWAMICFNGPCKKIKD